MKFNFISNLSLLKSARIKKILSVEIFQDYLRLTLLYRKEKIYKLKKETSLHHFTASPVEKMEFGSNFDEIYNLVHGYLVKEKLENIHVLIGINECQYQKVNIPVDVEDDEIWFIENSAKFLPEGRPVSEFIYSCRKTKDDDFSRNYLVAITRKDYIDKIAAIFSRNEFEIIGIMPFISSFILNKDLLDGNKLLLIFLINKLQYAYVSEAGYFEPGELYYNNPGDPNDLSGILLNDILILDQMLVKGEKSLESLTVITSAPAGLESQIKSLLQNNLSIKPDFYEAKLESQAIPATLAAQGLFKDFENKINFAPEDLSGNSRNKIEKRVFLNSVFACGAVLLVLLLFSNLFTIYSGNEQSMRTEDTMNLEQKQAMLKKSQEDNNSLKTNISMMNKLKDKKSIYSNILIELDKITTDNCCLTGVEIKNSNNYLNLNITGIAYSQGDISDLIRKMESLNRFKDISLVYSSSVNTEEMSLSGRLRVKKVVQFNIKSGCYAN